MGYEMVTLHLDGRPQQVRSTIWQMWMRTLPESSPLFVQVDPEATIDWAELDQLPDLRNLTYEGTDAGIERYLATRPGIESLTLLDHRRATVDLRETSITGLSIDHTTGPLTVLVPPTCNGMNVLGPEPADDVRVQLHDGQAFGVGLHADVPSLPAGLDTIHRVWFWHSRHVDLAAFAHLAGLETLGFFGVGRVTGLAHLSAFPRLRELNIHECYDLDADELPDLAELPSLTKVDAYEIRSTDGASLRTRLGGAATFTVARARNETWLRENLDNPFRNWPEEYGTPVGNAAKKAYKQAAVALRRAAKATGDADTPTTEQVLRAFIDALNRRDAKESFETTMAEDAAEAFFQLAAAAQPPVDDRTAEGWFDEWRNF